MNKRRAKLTYKTNLMLTDLDTGKTYRATGGGYDRKGYVFGEWLQDVLSQDELADAHAQGLYGVNAYRDGTLSLNGAVGLPSMQKIAKSAGWHTTEHLDKKDRITGFEIELAPAL